VNIINVDFRRPQSVEPELAREEDSESDQDIPMDLQHAHAKFG
jgi:hypothetical protein